MRRTMLALREPVFSPLEYFSREFERELGNRFEYNLSQFYETDEAYLATVDIPGVNFSDINIEVEDNKLMISAERKNPFDKSDEPAKKYHQRINLPEQVDQDKINAHYENGVLSLTFPKLIDNKTKKKIEVMTGQKPKSWTSLLSFGKNEKSPAIN